MHFSIFYKFQAYFPIYDVGLHPIFYVCMALQVLKYVEECLDDVYLLDYVICWFHESWVDVLEIMML